MHVIAALTQNERKNPNPGKDQHQHKNSAEYTRVSKIRSRNMSTSKKSSAPEPLLYHDVLQDRGQTTQTAFSIHT